MRENNFDLLRLYAALQVLLMHTLHHLFLSSGYEVMGGVLMFKSFISYTPGVSIFFLISGFLIAMSYEKNSNLKEYAKNRILRIYPALYINILISAGILYYFGFIEFNLEFFRWLVAQMSIIQFYNTEMFREFGVGVINGSLWTISVELTFYIALPVMYFLYKKSRWIVGVILLVSFALWVYDTTSNRDIFYNKFLHVSIFPYLYLFLIGIGFYKFYDNLKILIEKKFFLWFLLFTIFNIAVNYFNITTNNIVYIFKWVIFSFMVFSFAFSFKGFSKKLLNGNDFTYGIYIYHMLIINILVHLKMVGEIKYFIYVFLGSIFLGVLSWYMVEKPFLKLKKYSLFKDMHS